MPYNKIRSCRDCIYNSLARDRGWSCSRKEGNKNTDKVGKRENNNKKSDSSSKICFFFLFSSRNLKHEGFAKNIKNVHDYFKKRKILIK
jgi:hypothetical protein